MPELMKPDWTKLVREHLSGMRAGNQDVVPELAAHLEEVYEHARVCGSGETEAIRLALDQVDDWQALAAEITCAQSEEDSMNHRTKTVLLPAIGVLFAVGLGLLFLGRAEILQRLMWTACMMLLLGAAASEANRLNLRTRSVWLPGFVSLVAASLFLFAEEIVLTHDASFYLTDISLRPSHLISGLPFWFYIMWLLAQGLCGALGAFLSRRGGGSPIARVVAGTFPALVMFLLCGLVIPLSAYFFEHKTIVLSRPSGLALGILLWAGVPAVAMLLGAAPFLREPALQRA